MGKLFEIIFRGKDEFNAERLRKNLEFEAKIRSLKRRIERLRNELYPTRSGIASRDDNLEEQVQDVGPSKKEQEMNELKRKLMGGGK